MLAEINDLIHVIHEEITEMKRKYKIIKKYERLNKLLGDLILLKGEYE